MNYLNSADLRGLVRLALHGASQVTDLVEDMHQTIAAPFDVLGLSRPGRTGGITGLVYRSIQGGYTLVGAGLDTALALLTPLIGEAPATPEREALLAVVNGLYGDYLAASQNPLAIDMSLRYGGRSLVLEREALEAAIPEAGPKLVLLVHGLCMNDLHWLRHGHDHVAALAHDLGYTPVYLHYNTGAHISSNGRAFAGLLETLLAQWPQPVEELTILGHSMGGLVARSACHYGSLHGHTWPARLGKLIFLGTPHHGSPWERVGAWTGKLYGMSRYTAPFRRLNMTRSAGITDLRFGNLVDEDWASVDRFAHGPDNRRIVPLPVGVACYAIAASRGAAAGDAQDRLLGDGLVPVGSALGLHQNPERSLALAGQWVGYKMSHADLLHRPEVFEQIKRWLGP